jgi:hypothetical protein
MQRAPLQRFADTHNATRRGDADEEEIQKQRDALAEISDPGQRTAATQKLDEIINHARTASKNAPVFLRLDHAVSQDTLNDLVPKLASIKGVPSRYAKTRKAYAAFDKQLSSMPEAEGHDPSSDLASVLRNLRANLTPGYIHAAANPGAVFDPHVVEENGTVKTTPLNRELLSFDNMARRLSRLTVPDVREPSYDPILDERIAEALEAMTKSLTAFATSADPLFNPATWDEMPPPLKPRKRRGRKKPAGPKPPNMVKRVAAQWLSVLPPDFASKAHYPHEIVKKAKDLKAEQRAAYAAKTAGDEDVEDKDVEKVASEGAEPTDEEDVEKVASETADELAEPTDEEDVETVASETADELAEPTDEEDAEKAESDVDEDVAFPGRKPGPFSWDYELLRFKKSDREARDCRVNQDRGDSSRRGHAVDDENVIHSAGDAVSSPGAAVLERETILVDPSQSRRKVGDNLLNAYHDRTGCTSWATLKGSL